MAINLIALSFNPSQNNLILSAGRTPLVANRTEVPMRAFCFVAQWMIVGPGLLPADRRGIGRGTIGQ